MWIIYAFIAIFLWSLVNIADSYLVERNKKIGHPIGSLVIFSSVFALITAALIFVFIGGATALSTKATLILILAGFCNLSWIVFYLYALKDEDVSSVIPWFLSVPVFGYLLGYLILGETMVLQQILGGVIIIAGGLVLSVKSSVIENKRSYQIRWKPILYMTLASFLIALWGVLFKFVAKDAGFWVSAFWEHVGLTIAGVITLIFISSYRKGFMAMLRIGGVTIFLVNTFAEVSTIVANLLSNFALLFVPVTLVYLVGVSQPAVVLILGALSTLFFPKILTENISKRNVLHKVISILIMSIGGIILLVS